MVAQAIETFNDNEFRGRAVRVSKLLPREEVEKRAKRSRDFVVEGT
jgi:hypothetical protein